MSANSISTRTRFAVTVAFAMVLAIVVTMFATSPARAVVDSVRTVDDVIAHLPEEGKVTAREPLGGSGPSVVMALEGPDVGEPILYDLARVSDESYEEMLALAPVVDVVRPGQITPQLSFGFGWYVYVYMNNSDVNVLWDSIPAFAAALCAGGGPWGAALCTVIAQQIRNQLPSRAVPYGHCAEMRVSYAGATTFGGYVKRSC